MKKSIIYLAIFILMAGCSSTSKRQTNLYPTYYYSDSQPKVDKHLDPNTDFSKYLTFKILPSKQLFESSTLYEIEEKQIMAFLRNNLELKGYKPVKAISNASFIIAVNGSNSVESRYYPPWTESILEYVPGKTYTIESSTTTSSYGSSDTSDSETITTITTPGEYITREKYHPGRTVYYDYVYVLFKALDNTTGNVFYTGSASARVAIAGRDMQDFRITSQRIILYKFLNRFPFKNNALEVPPEKKYSREKPYLGLSIEFFTIDGNNYYPTVIDINRQSPAYRINKGQQNLKKEDMIISINGIPTKNISGKKLLDIIRSFDFEEKINLKVMRLEEVIDVSFKMRRRLEQKTRAR